MPKEPDLVLFKCESCGRTLKANARMATHLLPFKRRLPIEANGRCRRCGGEHWTISVIFVEMSDDNSESAIGFALAVLGIGIPIISTSRSQTDYANVPARMVAELNQEPRERMQRIALFAQAMERDKLAQRGARECPTCGTLFVPAAGKSWTQMGYCTQVCLVEDEESSANPAFTELTEGAATPVAELTPANCIRVRCDSGHSFDVQSSFSGLKRRCPVCGKKTRVP